MFGPRGTENHVDSMIFPGSSSGDNICRQVNDVPDSEDRVVSYYTTMFDIGIFFGIQNGIYFIGDPGSIVNVPYNFGSAGFEEPTNALSARAYVRSQYLSYTYLPHYDWVGETIGFPGWHTLISSEFSSFEYLTIAPFVDTTSLIDIDYTVFELGSAGWVPVFESVSVPDPDGTPLVFAKNNRVADFEECLDSDCDGCHP